LPCSYTKNTSNKLCFVIIKTPLAFIYKKVQSVSVAVCAHVFFWDAGEGVDVHGELGGRCMCLCHRFGSGVAGTFQVTTASDRNMTMEAAGVSPMTLWASSACPVGGEDTVALERTAARRRFRRSCRPGCHTPCRRRAAGRQGPAGGSGGARPPRRTPGAPPPWTSLRAPCPSHSRRTPSPRR